LCLISHGIGFELGGNEPAGGAYCVVAKNIHTPPPHGRFFCSLTLPHPSRNSSLASYFPLKKCAFGISVVVDI